MYDGLYCAAAAQGKGRGLIVPLEEEAQEEGEVFQRQQSVRIFDQ